MGLSGRMLEGYPTGLAVGGSIVILDVQGEGMLRTLGLLVTQGYMKVKIEVDSIIIFDGEAYRLTDAGATNSIGGFGVTIKTGASTMQNRRVLNLPFNTRLKITISNIHSGAWGNAFGYNADYVLDIK